MGQRSEDPPPIPVEIDRQAHLAGTERDTSFDPQQVMEPLQSHARDRAQFTARTPGKTWHFASGPPGRNERSKRDRRSSRGERSQRDCHEGHVDLVLERGQDAPAPAPCPEGFAWQCPPTTDREAPVGRELSSPGTTFGRERQETGTCRGRPADPGGGPQIVSVAARGFQPEAKIECGPPIQRCRLVRETQPRNTHRACPERGIGAISAAGGCGLHHNRAAVLNSRSDARRTQTC